MNTHKTLDIFLRYNWKPRSLIGISLSAGYTMFSNTYGIDQLIIERLQDTSLLKQSSETHGGLGGGLSVLMNIPTSFGHISPIAQYTFWFAFPTDRTFLAWVAALGFFSGIYFGWMPLCLPELFPTRSRSTGAGVSFNFGRILTVATVFAAGALMHVFEGDYARIGRVTSLVFALGLIAIWLAPDTSGRQLKD